MESIEADNPPVESTLALTREAQDLEAAFEAFAEEFTIAGQQSQPRRTRVLGLARALVVSVRRCPVSNQSGSQCRGLHFASVP